MWSFLHILIKVIIGNTMRTAKPHETIFTLLKNVLKVKMLSLLTVNF